MSKDDKSNKVVSVTRLPQPPPILTNHAKKLLRKQRAAHPMKLQIKRPPRMRVRDPNKGKALASLKRYVYLQKEGLSHEQIGDLFEFGRRFRLRPRGD